MRINIQPLVHKLELLQYVKDGSLSILCWLGLHEWSPWGEWRNFMPLDDVGFSKWQQEREKMCWWCDAIKREYRTVVLKY